MRLEPSGCFVSPRHTTVWSSVDPQISQAAVLHCTARTSEHGFPIVCLCTASDQESDYYNMISRAKVKTK